MPKVVFSDIKNDLSIGQSGSLKLLVNVDSIRQSIMTILTTKYGERVMLPEFGCILGEYLFDPIDSITERLMRSTIIEALARWEDRISITGVSVTADADNSSYVIAVNYFVRATLQTGTFIGKINAAPVE